MFAEDLIGKNVILQLKSDNYWKWGVLEEFSENLKAIKIRLGNNRVEIIFVENIRIIKENERFINNNKKNNGVIV